MILTRLAVSPSALLAAALVAPLAVAAPQIDLCRKPVLFKADLTTAETVSPAAPGRCPGVVTTVPDNLAGITTGSGQASHLGAVTLTASDCILQPGEYAPQGLPAGSACGTMPSPLSQFCDGRFTLVAANGDMLNASYAGALLPTADPTVFTLAGAYIVTGGTGRFANACGRGVLEGTEKIIPGGPQPFPGQLRAIGGISY